MCKFNFSLHLQIFIYCIHFQYWPLTLAAYGVTATISSFDPFAEDY